MRRAAVAVLVLAFLTLGSGALEYVHNLSHLHQHAEAAGHHDDAPADDQHDATNCFLHAMLRAPLLSGGWTPILICLGLFVAFLTMLSARPAAQRVRARIDCRGPPALLPVPA